MILQDDHGQFFHPGSDPIQDKYDDHGQRIAKPIFLLASTGVTLHPDAEKWIQSLCEVAKAFDDVPERHGELPTGQILLFKIENLRELKDAANILFEATWICKRVDEDLERLIYAQPTSQKYLDDAQAVYDEILNHMEPIIGRLAKLIAE